MSTSTGAPTTPRKTPRKKSSESQYGFKLINELDTTSPLHSPMKSRQAFVAQQPQLGSGGSSLLNAAVASPSKSPSKSKANLMERMAAIHAPELLKENIHTAAAGGATTPTKNKRTTPQSSPSRPPLQPSSRHTPERNSINLAVYQSTLPFTPIQAASPQKKHPLQSPEAAASSLLETPTTHHAESKHPFQSPAAVAIAVTSDSHKHILQSPTPPRHQQHDYATPSASTEDVTHKHPFQSPVAVAHSYDESEKHPFQSPLAVAHPSSHSTSTPSATHTKHPLQSPGVVNDGAETPSSSSSDHAKHPFQSPAAVTFAPIIIEKHPLQSPGIALASHQLQTTSASLGPTRRLFNSDDVNEISKTDIERELAAAAAIDKQEQHAAEKLDMKFHLMPIESSSRSSASVSLPTASPSAKRKRVTNRTEVEESETNDLSGEEDSDDDEEEKEEAATAHGAPESTIAASSPSSKRKRVISPKTVAATAAN